MMLNTDYEIFKTLFGSRLYGLNTDSSDWDYKSVYMPSVNSLISGCADLTNSYHSIVLDNDTENMSIHKFLALAKQGQTMAIDMLFSNVAAKNIVWTEYIEPIRDKFITKNMNAFIGYAKSQAIKYSNRGKNLNNLRIAYDILNNNMLDHDKFNDAIINNKFNDVKYEIVKDKNNIEMISINGLQFHTDVNVKFVKDTLKKHINKYGNRSNEAGNNEGFDYKAISHAFRVN